MTIPPFRRYSAGFPPTAQELGKRAGGYSAAALSPYTGGGIKPARHGSTGQHDSAVIPPDEEGSQ